MTYRGAVASRVSWTALVEVHDPSRLSIESHAVVIQLFRSVYLVLPFADGGRDSP